MNRPSINNLQELLDNENYNKFHTQKKQIQAKYDERLFHWLSPTTKPAGALKEWYLKEGYKQWREYLKEIGDLMLKPDSDYQKFVWDIIPAHIQRKMDEEYGDI